MRLLLAGYAVWEWVDPVCTASARQGRVVVPAAVFDHAVSSNGIAMVRPLTLPNAQRENERRWQHHAVSTVQKQMVRIKLRNSTQCRSARVRLRCAAGVLDCAQKVVVA